MFAFIKPMKKKYFIAIVLKEDLFEKAELLKRELFEEYGLQGALRSPAHITLHRPFEWKEEKENVLTETLGKFEFSKPFTIELNNFNCFKPRVIYIDLIKNETLYQLHSQLVLFAQKNLGLLNEAEDMRGFHPHITVAFRDLKKPLFYLLWEKFKGRNFRGSLQVAEISLLKLEDKWKILKSFSI